MSKMITDDRFTADGRETLAGSGKMWSTEIQTLAGPVIRVRRVGTHDMKHIADRDQPAAYTARAPGLHKDGTHRSREVFVDYRVSVDGRLVNSFLSKSLAMACAKRLAAQTDAVFA